MTSPAPTTEHQPVVGKLSTLDRFLEEAAEPLLAQGHVAKPIFSREGAGVVIRTGSSDAAKALMGKTVAAELGVDPDLMLFTGMAIGHADPGHVLDGFRAERAPLDEVAEFIGL